MASQNVPNMIDFDNDSFMDLVKSTESVRKGYLAGPNIHIFHIHDPFQFEKTASSSFPELLLSYVFPGVKIGEGSVGKGTTFELKGRIEGFEDALEWLQVCVKNGKLDTYKGRPLSREKLDQLQEVAAELNIKKLVDVVKARR